MIKYECQHCDDTLFDFVNVSNGVGTLIIHAVCLNCDRLNIFYCEIKKCEIKPNEQTTENN